MSTPPKPSVDRPGPARWRSAAICGSALLGALLLWLVNPAAAGWLPPCPWHALTGLQCPGCGSLRAIHSLLHLDWAQALALNPLACLCLPFLGLWWLWHARRALTGRQSATPFIRPFLLWSIVLLVFFFSIWRNIPNCPA